MNGRLGPAALLLVALLAGCARDPAGTLFRTTVAAPDGSYPQEVVLGDRTGLVLRILPADWNGQGGFDPASVVNLPGDRNVLIFRWSSGACDRPAIALSAIGDRFELRVDPRPKLGACEAILLLRAIRIDVIESIPAERVDICCPR
jgi:hypothetical protein